MTEVIDDDDDDLWEDPMEDQPRFQELDTTSLRGKDSPTDSGGKTPIVSQGQESDLLTQAASRLAKEQIQRGPIKEKSGSAVGMYRVSSITAVEDRPSSRTGTRKKQAPLPVSQTPVPLQYPRPPSRFSRPTSPASSKERASNSTDPITEKSYPLNSFLPRSRPGSRMASMEPDEQTREPLIKEKEPPMKMWNVPSVSSFVSATQPLPVPSTSTFSSRTSPRSSAYYPTSSESPVSSSYLPTSPSTSTVTSSSSPGTKCPHCTIHSWLPHSQNCPNGGTGEAEDSRLAVCKVQYII